VRFARLSVDGYNRRAVPLEAQGHHAGEGAIDQAEAQTLAGFYRLIAGNGAVQCDDIADVAGHGRFHAVAEARSDPAVRGQTPVRHHPDEIAINDDGRGFLDDERAGQAAAELLEAVGMRVVPERAGVRRREFVNEAVAGADRRLGKAGHAVHGVGHADAVPMDRCVLTQRIVHHDAHGPALRQTEGRPGLDPVVGPDVDFWAIGAHQGGAGRSCGEPIVWRIGRAGRHTKLDSQGEPGARLKEPPTRDAAGEMTWHSELSRSPNFRGFADVKPPVDSRTLRVAKPARKRANARGRPRSASARASAKFRWFWGDSVREGVACR